MAKVLRKIIEVDEELCNGCGKCVLACQEGAIAIIDGKARLVSEILCDGLGACLGECPTGALRIVEREAEPFDERAVEEHLHQLKKGEETFQPAMACGCPSTQVRYLETEEKPVSQPQDIPSSLTHWPVQIRLIPTHAPFLRDAHLLVCADCVPVAYPELHTKLLPGKKVMIGCPKFDPADLYIEKFAEIFSKVPLRSLELAIMEVPCCRGLLFILDQARRLANKDFKFKVHTIGVKGEILRTEEA
jgi:Fe-S-cluster-containing hydrogenase component 2